MKAGMRVQVVGVCACGCGRNLYNEGRMWKLRRFASPGCRDRQQSRDRLNRRRPGRERRGNYAPKA